MYREEIEQYIEAHKHDMVEDIFTLCRINSEKMPYEEGMPYGRGAATALAAALSMAEKYGFAITNYDNYVGTADMNDKEKQLDILAHLDVVPAGEGWKETEPFEPILKDGLLIGRGTADDKGPAVAALYAMRAVKELGIPLSKNVRLILGTDEECGSSDIEHYYGIEKEAPMTFSPDADFPVTNVEKGRLEAHFHGTFEPSAALPRLVGVDTGIKANVVPGKAQATVEGFEMTVLEECAAKTEQETGVRFMFEASADGEVSSPHVGSADGEVSPPHFGSADGVDRSQVTITAIGEGAHAAFLEGGNNALTGLLTLFKYLPFAPCAQIDAVRGLVALMPHKDVTGIAMGIAMEDEISGPLTLAFSMLKVTDRELNGVFDSRCPVCGNKENVLYVVRDKMTSIGLTLENQDMKEPHHVDGDSHFVKTLLRVYEEYTGLEGKCQYTGGGTYVHDLKNGVAFGATLPGTENRMHGADEFAVLEELVVSAKIFAQVIVDLCS